MASGYLQISPPKRSAAPLKAREREREKARRQQTPTIALYKRRSLLSRFHREARTLSQVRNRKDLKYNAVGSFLSPETECRLIILSLLYPFSLLSFFLSFVLSLRIPFHSIAATMATPLAPTHERERKRIFRVRYKRQEDGPPEARKRGGRREILCEFFRLQ